MRHTPRFITEDVDEVKRLIRENPWATFVSSTPNGMVASHYPVMLEEDSGDEIRIVSHFGRPDEKAHELGEHEVLVVIAGPHGYISPGWYLADQFVPPTWNHVTAHLYGRPEILSEDENFQVLGRLTDSFEQRLPQPKNLATDADSARVIAKGTIGLRMRVTRFDARLKLSQNKDPEVVERVIAQLETGEHYANPELAREMRRVHRT